MNIKYRTLIPLMVVSVLATLLVGCGTTPTRPTEGDEPVDYTNSGKIRVGDMLRISFRGPVSVVIPDHEERVSESGKINLPSVGEVEAAGKNRVDLQKDIAKLYIPGIYKRMTVTIAPDERFFYVSGDVMKPDRHFYAGELTVRGAISAAGGFTDFANQRKVQLTRGDDTIEVIDCKKALRNPKLDIEVLPGDRIFVPKRVF